LYLFFSCKGDDINSIGEISFSTGNTDLYFQSQSSSDKVYIKNNGKEKLKFKVTIDNHFLVSSTYFGSINSSDSLWIELTPNPGRNLPADFAKVIVKIDPETQNSLLVNVIHYKEEKWLLNEQIKDAEYDKINDVIIAVTISNKLLKIDPENKTFGTVDLKVPVECVSVSQDGKYAATGHKGIVSLVNLEKMAVEKAYGLPFNVLDITLTSELKSYLINHETDYSSLQFFDLTTGDLFRPSTVYSEASIIKLNSNLGSLYAHSYRNFEKYSLVDGTLKFDYKKDFSLNMPSGDFWLSEDGAFLIHSNGSILNCSKSKSEDLVSIGKLAAEGLIVAMDHSVEKGKIGAILLDIYNPIKQYSKEVTIYNSSFDLMDTYKLPSFLYEDLWYRDVIEPSDGKYLFFNSAGTACYVFVQHTAPITYKTTWALVNINVE
jgi:hypothetical protein